jgi:hypothetical protein
MSIMTNQTLTCEIVAGVDTHRDTCWVAVVDTVGCRLGDHEFTADPNGYKALARFITSYGQIILVGVGRYWFVWGWFNTTP